MLNLLTLRGSSGFQLKWRNSTWPRFYNSRPLNWYSFGFHVSDQRSFNFLSLFFCQVPLWWLEVLWRTLNSNVYDPFRELTHFVPTNPIKRTRKFQRLSSGKKPNRRVNLCGRSLRIVSSCDVGSSFKCQTGTHETVGA